MGQSLSMGQAGDISMSEEEFDKIIAQLVANGKIREIVVWVDGKPEVGYEYIGDGDDDG